MLLSHDQRFEHVDQQVSELQWQVQQLSKEVASQRKTPRQSRQFESPDYLTELGRRESNRREASPAYIGPTSNEYGLQDAIVAIRATDTNSIQQDLQGNVARQDSVFPHHSGSRQVAEERTELGVKMVLDLIDAYDDSVGILCPFLDVISQKEFARKAMRNNKLCDRVNLRTSSPLSCTSHRDVEILKMVLATVLIAKDDWSNMGLRLADSVETTMGLRLKVHEVDLKEIMILVLLVRSAANLLICVLI